MAALVMAAGLAALMSTMDSQLLTLSSIFTRDVVPLFQKTRKETAVTGRIFVVLLSLAGLALAYSPPATILQIATQTFTGLAVLFPTVIFGLYFKRVFSLSAILSIICGESALICFYFKLFTIKIFLPVIWIMIITFLVYLITHIGLLWREKELHIRMPQWLYNRYVWLLFAVFLLAMDFWAWGRVEPVIFGIPLWVGYFIILSAMQTIIMIFLIKKASVDKF